MPDINGFPVVDDSTGHLNTQGRGYEPRDYARFPLNGLKCARQFSLPIIPASEHEGLIRDKTAAKSWASDLCDQAGLTVKNQQNSSYCWIHAPTHGMEVNYVLQGGKVFVLSAFYGGALIKNGRNQGGSGIEGAQWLSEHGTCLESMHPPMSFSTQNSADTIANAALHKLVTLEEIDSDDHASIITSIFEDSPVTVGIPAWGHEILITFLIWQPGANLIPDFPNIVYGFDNSWGTSWGKNGRGTLSRAYSRFDEAGTIRSVTPATV